MRDVAVIGAGPAGLTPRARWPPRGHDVVVLEEHASDRRAGALHRRARPRRLCRIRSSPRSPSSAPPTPPSSSRPTAAPSSVDADARQGRGRRSRALRSGACRREPRAPAPSCARRARPRRSTVDATRVTHRRRRRGRRSTRARASSPAAPATASTASSGSACRAAFVQSAQLEQPFDGPDSVEVHLGREVAPGGFAWLVPFDARRASHSSALGPDVRHARAAARFRDVRRRACATGSASPADGWPEPRLKILPLGPVSRTYGTRAARRRRCRGTRQADDRRRDLLQPDQRPACRRARSTGRCASDDLSDIAAARATRPSGAAASAPRSAPASRSARSSLAHQRSRDRRLDRTRPRSTASIPLLRQTADFNWHRRSALALLRHAQFRRILLSSIWS